jgi:hypothetical protein
LTRILYAACSRDNTNTVPEDAPSGRKRTTACRPDHSSSTPRMLTTTSRGIGITSPPSPISERSCPSIETRRLRPVKIAPRRSRRNSAAVSNARALSCARPVPRGHRDDKRGHHGDDQHHRHHFDEREAAQSVSAPRSRCLPHCLSPPRAHQNRTTQSHRVDCDPRENDIGRDGPRGRAARGHL